MDKEYSWYQTFQFKYISIYNLFRPDMPGPFLSFSLSLSALFLTFGFWQVSRSPWCTKLLMPGTTQSNCDRSPSLAWKEMCCTNIKSEKKDMNLNPTSLLRSLCTTFKASTKDDDVGKTLNLKKVQIFQSSCDSPTSLAQLSWVLDSPEPLDIALLWTIQTHPSLCSFFWWCKMLSGVIKIHPLWKKEKKMFLIGWVLLLLN